MPRCSGGSRAPSPMAAAGPSVFLLMVSGQVESAQVSGQGPTGPAPQTAWGCPQPPGCCVARGGSSLPLGGERQHLRSLARLPAILKPDVRACDTESRAGGGATLGPCGRARGALGGGASRGWSGGARAGPGPRGSPGVCAPPRALRAPTPALNPQILTLG